MPVTFIAISVYHRKAKPSTSFVPRKKLFSFPDVIYLHKEEAPWNEEIRQIITWTWQMSSPSAAPA